MVVDRFDEAYVPDVVGEDDLAYFEKGGHGARVGWGTSPGVIVVDMTAEFTGDEYQLGRSDTGAAALEANARLLETARRANLPVFYTLPGLEGAPGYPRSNERKKESPPPRDGEGNAIHPTLEPTESDVVVRKPRPSGFFETHLDTMLRYDGVDTPIITGMTTSGCVRATVVDAMSHNYHPIVPIECVADRSVLSHEVSLFDMDMKYADVTPLDQVVERIEALG